jgi:ABC transporter substrate binding protein (PQQ-dependent alcohol dehydrogenase system)
MRWHEPMTADAWAAWAGVKGVWESSLRARTTDPHALAKYLVSDQAQFDGHKGRPLSFRSWDRQLRQPVYVMRKNDAGAVSLVAEEPSVAPTDEESSRDVLDRIGTREAQSACRVAP